MSANILVVGGGNGSWQIRGVQLGAALGARVTTSPTEHDWRWADVCILVKRALGPFAAVAHSHGVPIVWDALDFWRQPEDNAATVDEAVSLARTFADQLRPDVIVGATQAMADDLSGVYLPHHSRPRLSALPVRAHIEVVAYEGTAKYLGSWRVALETVCARLGMAFVVNPPDLRVADLVVAFRGERWDGPICRRWKSGVKVVNAMAAGRPILTHPSTAFAELQAPGLVLTDPADLEEAIHHFESQASRTAAAEECRRRAGQYELSAVARRYRGLLATALQVAA